MMRDIHLTCDCYAICTGMRNFVFCNNVPPRDTSSSASVLARHLLTAVDSLFYASSSPRFDDLKSEINGLQIEIN